MHDELKLEARVVNDIAVMMSEFVDNWPAHKKVSTSIALIAKTLREALHRPTGGGDAEVWEVRPCGHNFDVCIRGEPGAKAAAIVATVFSGEVVARRIASDHNTGRTLPVERVADWWKPDPEDPFWMLENDSAEWLKNEHSGLFTRDPVKALRFPSKQAADCKRRSLEHPFCLTLKPTEHTWIALSLTRTAGGEEVDLREALAGLVEGVRRHCNEPGGGGISGFLSARLTDAENALTKPPALPIAQPDLLSLAEVLASFVPDGAEWPAARAVQTMFCQPPALPKPQRSQPSPLPSR